jgi:redox-sensitive bicupin YhaK (pirin superfamily)
MRPTCAWLHVVDGDITIEGGFTLSVGQALCASASSVAGELSLRTNTSAHFVDEPVIQHSPFVFESETSLASAIADLKAGHFGQVDSVE